jgi:VanZ family protein
MLVLVVIYLSLTPIPIQLPVDNGDKFGHAFAYFVLMWWFANLHESTSSRALYAAGFTALAIVLEFVQRWSGYRTFEVADMVAGAAGVAAGWMLAPPRLPNCLHLMERYCRS